MTIVKITEPISWLLGEGPVQLNLQPSYVNASPVLRRRVGDVRPHDHHGALLQDRGQAAGVHDLKGNKKGSLINLHVTVGYKLTNQIIKISLY